MKSSVRPALGLALAFLALHLPYLPVSLEDLDSINFALGLRQFDVAQHQPHPPGYPVFIALAHLANAVSSSEVRALSLVSVVSAAVAMPLVAALFAAWTNDPRRHVLAVIGAVMVATTPLFWMTAARPLSDMAGLAAAVAVQWLTVRATTARAVAVAAAAAGLAAGIRSQVVWLTVPLLVATVLMQPGSRFRTGLTAAVGYALGGLAWGIPLLVLSGGMGAYLAALRNQGTEDFTGVAMLATQPSPRLLAAALYSTLVAPWDGWPLALLVILAAIVGLVICWRTDRRALAGLVIAFGPYAVFDLLLQETVTTRYALPLVIPIAYLAARGTTAPSLRTGLVATVVISITGIVTTMPKLAAYARQPAPAFRVLEDMRAAQSAGRGPAPVLAMHRRQELDMRRPIVWNRGPLANWSAHLPAPPKHEWMELVTYWNGGGRAPVWLLADPPRSDLRLIDRRSLARRGEYRWPFESGNLLGGVRPNVMDWYEVPPPNWYVGEGWALTPETAGVARDEGRGPGRAPIQGWVRRHDGPAILMIGGRNLAPGGDPVPVMVTLDGRSVFETRVAPGFFLQFVAVDAALLAGAGDYATLAVSAGGGDAIAIEQFDLQKAGDIVYGYGDGWQELEYNPVTGRLWRWSSEKAVLRVHGRPQPTTLHLVGEFETSAPTAHVVVRAGDRVIGEYDVPRAFALEIPVPASAIVEGGETVVTLETDQWYVPAETNWRPTGDRRHLGLRLFECELRPAS